MPVILRNVGHRFGEGSWLFRDLSVSLEPGRSYALVGPSGSGKTTLLGLIAGWDSPSEGVIDRDSVQRIGWVFQNPHGVPRRSALDHVTLPLLAAKVPIPEAEERARALLARVGLDRLAMQEFRSLSGGEAQRLMLARALAAEPDLLLVDEPTAQLDQATAAEVDLALSALAEDGLLVVIATHDPRTRDACSDVLDLAEHSARVGEQ